MSVDAAPLLSTLVERLRGIYRLGVNDGAGLLDGKDTFTRQFQTPPIQHEAAGHIEALTTQRDALLSVLQKLSARFDDYRDSDCSQADAHNILVDYALWAKARAAISQALGGEA